MQMQEVLNITRMVLVMKIIVVKYYIMKLVVL